jgi:hypothetical protein
VGGGLHFASLLSALVAATIAVATSRLLLMNSIAWAGCQMVKEVRRLICQGYTDVVDADLSRYFDSIPHDELLKSVARRIVDRRVLRLIKLWVKAPIEERHDSDGPGASVVARATRAARLRAVSRAHCSPTST